MRRVAIESQDKIVGGLVAPSTTDNLGGRRDTRLCDMPLDCADKISHVAATTRESSNRTSSEVSDEGVLHLLNGFWSRQWLGFNDRSGGPIEVGCNDTILGVAASGDARGEAQVEGIDDLILGHHV